MTLELNHVILLPIHKGGGYIYVIIIFILSIFLSYYIVSIYYITIKSKYIKSNNSLDPVKINIRLLESKSLKYKNILKNLNNPYGINFIRFKVIKYIISPFIFVIILFRSHNFILSFIYYLCCFYIPNLLINLYSKNESLKIINDISEVSNSLKLALSCNIPLHQSLIYVKENIEYKRFRESFDIFINDYMMYNFNMIKAIDNFKLKFNSYEFNMFLNIILQGDKDGKILKSLEIFSETLDLSYFKFLKYKEVKRIVFVTISSIISLINITILAVYPIIIQISENLKNVFN